LVLEPMRTLTVRDNGGPHLTSISSKVSDVSNKQATGGCKVGGGVIPITSLRFGGMVRVCWIVIPFSEVLEKSVECWLGVNNRWENSTYIRK